MSLKFHSDVVAKRINIYSRGPIPVKARMASECQSQTLISEREQLNLPSVQNEDTEAQRHRLAAGRPRLGRRPKADECQKAHAASMQQLADPENKSLTFLLHISTQAICGAAGLAGRLCSQVLPARGPCPGQGGLQRPPLTLEICP